MIKFFLQLDNAEMLRHKEDNTTKLQGGQNGGGLGPTSPADSNALVIHLSAFLWDLAARSPREQDPPSGQRDERVSSALLASQLYPRGSLPVAPVRKIQEKVRQPNAGYSLSVDQSVSGRAVVYGSN